MNLNSSNKELLKKGRNKDVEQVYKDLDNLDKMTDLTSLGPSI